MTLVKMTMVMFRTLCVGFLTILLPKGCISQLNVCGVAPLNTKIVGGQNAAAGSWPWQVSLRLTADNFHFCGGSLINSDWVLTAAHCFKSYTASQVTVHLGAQNLQENTINKVSVTSVTKHPKYDSSTNDNDLALLQLSSPVTFTNYITPVCLADSDSTFFNGTLTWVTGWGNIASGVSLPAPGTLQEVQVPVIGNRKCYCLYQGGITSNMICAGPLSGGKDSCQGDSGGPLVIKQGSIWIQAGIVSFGDGCAQPNYPGVYTRVSQYKNWINQVIISNQPGYITYTSSGTNADLSVSCSILPPVTTVATTTTTTTTTTPPVVCGSASLNNLSGVGSGFASAGTWPWMASIQRNGTHVCGGTLIAAQFVMSSADCFSGSSNSSDWTVILGRLKQNGSNPNEVSVKVSNITFSNTSQNNIAVLQLTVKPTLSIYIQPICVDQGSNNFAVNTQCWAAGWVSGGGAEQTLQQFSTSIVSCDSGSPANSICTGAFQLEQSESGGPLMCQVGTSWFQAAVLTVPTSSANSSSTSNNSSSTSNNSTVTSNTTTNSRSRRSIELDAAAQNSNKMVFSKTSTYSTFLLSTLGSLPRNTTSSSSVTTSKPNHGGIQTFLSITSVLLLSLPGIVQTFG